MLGVDFITAVDVTKAGPLCLWQCFYHRLVVFCQYAICIALSKYQRTLLNWNIGSLKYRLHIILIERPLFLTFQPLFWVGLLCYYQDSTIFVKPIINNHTLFSLCSFENMQERKSHCWSNERKSPHAEKLLCKCSHHLVLAKRICSVVMACRGLYFVFCLPFCAFLSQL